MTTTIEPQPSPGLSEALAPRSTVNSTRNSEGHPVTRISARAAAICGLAAPASFVAGVVPADVAQPAAFSVVNDDISDLGALTASSPWLYNQVAANLTGILVVGFALGLWAALGRGVFSRVGVVGLVVVGAGIALDGLFRLDCQGIDAGCDNTSWHSSAHRIESGVTAAAFLLTPLVLAFAFRRLPAWRHLWLPTLLATPALLATSAAFSALGPGLATRAGSTVWFLWLALVAFHLLRVSTNTATAGTPRRPATNGSAFQTPGWTEVSRWQRQTAIRTARPPRPRPDLETPALASGTRGD